MDEEDNRTTPRGSTPVPDPTILTTEALNREISNVRELLKQDIESLGALVEEKFRSVDKQFELIENQRVEQKTDTKAAVVDALAAAKEIVREQSANFKEQLTQITLTFSTALAGLTKQVDDMKERVAKIEAIKIGGNEAKGSVYAIAGFVLTLILIVTAIGAFAVAK